jgi:hypothetical protein
MFPVAYRRSIAYVYLLRFWSHSGLENREYGRGYPLRWRRDILYPQKLALTSPTSGGRSVGIVLLRTKATEFVRSEATNFYFFETLFVRVHPARNSLMEAMSARVCLQTLSCGSHCISSEIRVNAISMLRSRKSVSSVEVLRLKWMHF